MSEFYLYESGSEPVRHLSAINRKFEVDFTKIVKEHRLANGSLKRDVVAVKRTWKFSWEWLPSKDDDVSDGGLGVESLETLFNSQATLVLRVPNEDSSYNLHNTLVAPDGFHKAMMLKRSSGKRYWNISLSLMET
jgi:hypothetical protein